MSTVQVLIRGSDEKLKPFNKRLAAACVDGDDPVTRAEMAVVNGMPVVSLFTDYEPPEEAAEGEEVALDVVGSPIVAKVVNVRVDNAGETEGWFDDVAEDADIYLEDCEIVQGTRREWVEPPGGGAPQYLETEVAYALLTWIYASDEEEIEEPAPKEAGEGDEDDDQ